MGSTLTVPGLVGACADCDRLMRTTGRGAIYPDVPDGTELVIHGGRGLCQACLSRHRRREAGDPHHTPRTYGTDWVPQPRAADLRGEPVVGIVRWEHDQYRLIEGRLKRQTRDRIVLDIDGDSQEFPLAEWQVCLP
ncbi:MAG TPA: hypothetical protein VGC45_15630 [Gryllotalpicola sp.]